MKSKPINTYAFLIDPISILAERTNSDIVNSTTLTQKNILSEIMDRWVRQRRNVEICRTEDVFINALKKFTDKKDELYRAFNEFPLLSKKSKKVMINYLDNFYSGFDKHNSIVYDLLNECY